MPRTAYKWSLLHKEYLSGSEVSVRSFLHSNGIPQNRNAFEHTKGWRSEKQALSKRAQGVVQEELEEEIVQSHYQLTELAIKLAPKIHEMLEEYIRWRALTPKQRRYETEQANKSGEPLPPRISIFEYCTLVRVIKDQLDATGSNKASVESDRSLTAVMAQLEEQERSSV